MEEDFKVLAAGSATKTAVTPASEPQQDDLADRDVLRLLALLVSEVRSLRTEVAELRGELVHPADSHQVRAKG